MKFKNRKVAEEYLKEKYVGKVLQVSYFSRNERKTYSGMLNRIAIDDATHDPALIILIFNDGKKFEFDKNEFNNQVSKL